MTNYKMGSVEGDSRKELGKNVVEHLGLGLPDDEIVGKRIRFKNPKVPYEMRIFTIIGRQRMWGYDDDDGKYTMIEGYRAVSSEGDFGKPVQLSEIEFVPDEEDFI